MRNYSSLHEGWARRAIARGSDTRARRRHRFGLDSARLGRWLLVGLVVCAPHAGEAQRMNATVPDSFGGVVQPSSLDTSLRFSGDAGGYRHSIARRALPHEVPATSALHSGINAPSVAANEIDVRRFYERGALPSDGRSSAVPYLIGGALIGAAAMTVGLVLYFRSDRAQDSITHPLILTPAVLGAASVGAAAGWLIHRLRTR